MGKKRARSPPTSPKKSAQKSIDTFFSSPKKPKIEKGTGSASASRPQHGPIRGVDQVVIDLVSSSDDEMESSAPVPSTSRPSGNSQNVFSFKMTANVEHGPSSEGKPPYERLEEDPICFDALKQFGAISLVPSEGIHYSFLANVLLLLTGTKSRIKILNILTNALRIISESHPASLTPAIYLLSNTLSPPYVPVELGLGHSIISQSIQHVSGLSSAALKKLYTSTGDPGDVAYAAKSKTRTLVPHPPLLIASVFESMGRISRCKGQGASKQKQAIVEKLLVAAKGEESRFLVRSLCQNLRVGAVRTSILTALARAMVLSPPTTALGVDSAQSQYHLSADLLAKVKPLVASAKGKSPADPIREEVLSKFVVAESLVRKTYVQHPNYDDIIAALASGGLDGLETNVSLSIGTPIYPALGTPVRSVDEIYEHLGENARFSAEFKYDGQRAQIHAWKDSNGTTQCAIFSRHLENMTSKYPDVVGLITEMVALSPSMTSFILDAEIVATDTKDGSLKTFQELSNRARTNVKLENVTIPVSVFAFDLLYLNGASLLADDFISRRKKLHDQLPSYKSQDKQLAHFCHVERCESEAGRDAIQAFWKRAVASRAEGVMVKLLKTEISDETRTVSPTKKGKKKATVKATYDADKRTYSWMKLKKDYVEGLGDSLDVIPIGAWHGNGRKASWWSPILLALWDEERGCPVAVCKCMSGFTDAFYKSLTDRYSLTADSATCSKTPQWECELGGFRPSVYFKPQEIWEIRGADITVSPISVAAKGAVSSSASRGLSLRFPRFIRTRDDKTVEQASTPAFLGKLWEKQGGKSTTGNDEGDLIDAESEQSVDDEIGEDSE